VRCESIALGENCGAPIFVLRISHIVSYRRPPSLTHSLTRPRRPPTRRNKRLASRRSPRPPSAVCRRLYLMPTLPAAAREQQLAYSPRSPSHCLPSALSSVSCEPDNVLCLRSEVWPLLDVCDGRSTWSLLTLLACSGRVDMALAACGTWSEEPSCASPLKGDPFPPPLPGPQPPLLLFPLLELPRSYGATGQEHFGTSASAKTPGRRRRLSSSVPPTVGPHLRPCPQPCLCLPPAFSLRSLPRPPSSAPQSPQPSLPVSPPASPPPSFHAPHALTPHSPRMHHTPRPRPPAHAHAHATELRMRPDHRPPAPEAHQAAIDRGR
jgi:hypothetical protein